VTLRRVGYQTATTPPPTTTTTAATSILQDFNEQARTRFREFAVGWDFISTWRFAKAQVLDSGYGEAGQMGWGGGGCALRVADSCATTRSAQVTGTRAS
jgi:hypothetical protein